jgi:hypothetical protein
MIPSPWTLSVRILPSPVPKCIETFVADILII